MGVARALSLGAISGLGFSLENPERWEGGMGLTADLKSGVSGVGGA